MDLNQQLLRQIQEDFLSRFNNSSKLTRLYAKINNKTATYADVSELSHEIGDLLSECFQEDINEDVEITEEMTEAVLKPMLQNNFDLISEAAKTEQQNLNEAAGIHLAPAEITFNTDKANGICQKAVEDRAIDYGQMIRTLGSNTVNFSMSVVDDSIKANAEQHFNAGFVPKIVRKANGHRPCAWCRSLEGTYEYPDVPEEVYHRHRDCFCTVTYTPAGEKVSQDVWSKKWAKEKDIQREQRIRADEAEQRRLSEEASARLRERIQAQ